MPWRKLESTFREDRKFKRLAKAIGVNRAEARGLVAGLWAWALGNAPDGDLSKLGPDEIEDAADWQGKPGVAFKAMTSKKIKLIDVKDGRTTIHNWISRGGTFAETKRKQALRKKLKDLSRDIPGPSRDMPGPSRDMPGVSREMPHKEENRIEEKIYITMSGSDPDLVDKIDKPPDQADKPKSGKPDQILEVWAHYRTHHPRCPKNLTAKRKEYRLIRDRLSDGYTVDELKQAIDGYHRSAFHCGQNSRQTKYLALGLIMRDIDHVREGLEMLSGKLTRTGYKPVNAP